MSKPDPMKLAHQFMGLNAEDFRMFWTIVGFEWNQEDGDIEAQWFYCGQHMRPTEVTVIGALHSAVASGQKSGKDRPRDAKAEAQAKWNRRAAASETETWQDRDDDLTCAIEESHPVSSGRHDLYARAMTLVGNRHSKEALVALVNHLLLEAEAAEARADRLASALEPFARVAEHDIGESESDADLFRAMSDRYCRAPLLTVGDFRRARTALGTIETGEDG